VLNLLAGGVTHLGVATDHVIESFRNDLWPGYKSSAGVPEELLAQFGLLEEALQALGVVVWPMVEFEADDALAAAARAAAENPDVDQVVIMTPDKDLSQCVVGRRVVQLDRRKDVVTDEAGVFSRYGIPPSSIPDWLALSGDSSDGFPGLPGWGAKSASAVLGRYLRLEDIPDEARHWEGVDVRGSLRLAATLAEGRPLAMLFRRLATLRSEIVLFEDIEELRWKGPTPALKDIALRLSAVGLAERAAALASPSAH